MPLPAGDLTGGHLLVDDLGLDSLSILELLDQVESRVGLTFDLEPTDLEGLNVQMLVDAVELARG